MRLSFMAMLLAALSGSLAVRAAAALDKDCSARACPELTVAGDGYDRRSDGTPSPFHGYADAVLRRDPDSGRLWMAYSWPHVKVLGGDGAGRRGRSGLPAVETHLAYSDDGGGSWRYHGVLWPLIEDARGITSIEVPNLLPRKTDTGTVWYGARLDYSVPRQGGMKQRSPQSFRVRVMQASSPPALSRAPAVSLGASDDPAWAVDVNLTALDPAVSHCRIWNEPALQFQDGELYLALSCMAFRGKAPDMARNDVVLFATRPQGEVHSWRWRYVGRLAGAAEAAALGGQRLTQIELARGRDGALLAIMTPDTWDAALQDFVHHGCRAVEVASLPEARLARDPDGRLKLRASVGASDAGAHGTAACAYDPASATGIVIGRRDKTNVALGGASGGNARMRVSLHATGVHP